MAEKNAIVHNRRDYEWVLGLFGTAVGAGILFLPIRAGISGFISVLVMTAIIFPAVWFGHRALGHFILTSKTPGGDITEAMKDHLGAKIGRTMSVLYFFCLWPVCMAYGVGITNTVGSFVINQLGYRQFSLSDYGFRAMIGGLLITLVVVILLKGRELVLKATNLLVYPLILTLLIFSLYLIPSWKSDSLLLMPTWQVFFSNIWLTLPVLVFAFNHSPALSPMIQDLQESSPGAERVEKRVGKIEFMTASLLTGFAMFFVISCILSLTPSELAQARAQNIPILSYFANQNNNRLIAWIGPMIAFVAIGSSFFTHLIGCIEAIRGSLVSSVAQKSAAQKKRLDLLIVLALYITMILAAVLNPNILDFMESLGGPIMAMMIFIMPVYAFYKVPELAKYKANLAVNIFIFVVGILTISSVVFKLLGGSQ
ncbi:MAG: serine transporter [Spirochaetia bacterium]